ncbi:MAG TPA: PKD domain-containing protein [Tepidisphaeraceae bacterium]|nr:PKD domain-containing protein [Tepidisphaeraceae bacterium]
MKSIICLVTCLFTAIALGVTTSTWTQTSQEDFKKGTLDNVVATNLGVLKLSRAVKTLLEQDPRISSVNALAQGADGAIYAGTGPQGVLLQIKDQSVSTVATIDDATNLTSLIVEDSGRLLVGTAGEKGRVLAIDKPGAKPHALFESDGIQYIWALCEASDGNVYAATGPTGKLFEIHPDGSHRLLLESGENNLLSLICDGKDTLYVGTDPHGLVYRVNRKTGRSFILYNAPESEIGALVLDHKGNLYAATSEAHEDRFPPAENPNVNQPHGRPEGGETGVPIPSQNPRNPEPPKLPNPNPGEPNPIPKHVEKTGLIDSQIRDHVLFIDDEPAALPPHPGPPLPGKPQPGQPPTNPDQGEAAPPPNRQPPVNTINAGEPRPQGNAVYKIDPDGFVTEIFRQPVLVLAMVEHQGTLLIATGSEGEIFQVNPAADETVVLAKVDPKQVTCLLPARDGNVYMGMANVGSIAMMSAGFASKGAYTSAVLDATQISRFGKMQLHGSLPPDTKLLVSTRSGNVKEPSEKGWSAWTTDVPAEEFLAITSPSARFLQYRLTFSNEHGVDTSTVDDVSVAYQIPNLPPQVKSVKVAPASQGSDNGAAPNPPSGENELRRVQPTPRQSITWEASDPNNDALQYSLYFRRTPTGPWILLKDKLIDSQFEWDTRSVADGRYEVKVVASDANANPPGQGKTASRVSDPIVVDNTPPVIGDLRWTQKGSSVQLDFKIVDETSTVAACDYSVDSNRDWQMTLPVDNIFDSPEETMSFSIPGLKPGQHQITLRATDAKGNQSFQTVFVTVKEPLASK